MVDGINVRQPHSHLGLHGQMCEIRAESCFGNSDVLGLYLAVFGCSTGTSTTRRVLWNGGMT